VSGSVDYIEVLEQAGTDLNSLTIQLGAAHARLDAAEVAWLGKYDLIAVELADQYEEKGRKTDPAEHTIVSATRRRFPDLYQELQQAKRAIKRLEIQSANKRSEVTANQSLVKNEREIGGAGAGGPQPAWSHRRSVA
jgi:hypothetical protein